MTDRELELSEAFRRMFAALARDHTIWEGTVVAGSVDETAYTCSVAVGDSQSGTTFTNVSLETLIGGPSSVISIPNDGSAVICCFRDGNRARRQVLKIDSVKKRIENPTELFQFGDGSNGGIPLATPVSDKLNILEDALNDLKDIFTAWVTVSGDGGAALKALLAAWLTVPIVDTVPADIENTKVTQ